MQATTKNENWVRCSGCGHKLFKGKGGWHEVKCHSCKTVNEVGTQFDKLIYLLEDAGVPFILTRIVKNGADKPHLLILSGNERKAEYEANMSFNADEEFARILKEA